MLFFIGIDTPIQSKVGQARARRRHMVKSSLGELNEVKASQIQRVLEGKP
jgi:hypothetical protein